jgi:hypothetical protein
VEKGAGPVKNGGIVQYFTNTLKKRAKKTSF